MSPEAATGGDGLQIWGVAVNMLNKQLQTADKGLSSSLGVRQGANNLLLKKNSKTSMLCNIIQVP
jgi:hypothetical protein